MLEDQITSINNPQEFTRLCNSVFTCKYGDEFQIIDGTRSDDGNDGYVRSEKRIFAIYCPIKPEKKTDKDFLGKIEDDLEKAVSLRDTDKLKIDHWTFVTPRKLSNDVIIKMNNLGIINGISVNHIEATFLANELYKNPHLLKAFPQLHVPSIEEKLDEIKDYIKKTIKEKEPSEGYPSGKPFVKHGTIESQDNKRVQELRNVQPTDSIKKELRVIFYKTGDIVAQLNALMGLLDAYSPNVDSDSEMIELCDIGINLTKSNEYQRYEAHFVSWKAYLLSFSYAKRYFSLMSSNLIALPSTDTEQFQSALDDLRKLYEQYNTCFNTAIDISVKNNDPKLLAGTFLLLGNSAGQRYIAYNTFSDFNKAENEKALCKRSLIAAKFIYSSLSDENGLINAVFNLANQIRFFGEKDEAIELAKESVEFFRKTKNNILLQKALRLEETLMTGIIKD